MITVTPLGGNVAEVQVRGPIAAEDYRVIRPALERVLENHDAVSLFIVINGVDGLTPAALWDDFKLPPELLGSLEYVAVMSDKTWVDGLMRATDPLLKGKLHHFEPGQRQTALSWLVSTELQADGHP